MKRNYTKSILIIALFLILGFKIKEGSSLINNFKQISSSFINSLGSTNSTKIFEELDKEFKQATEKIKADYEQYRIDEITIETENKPHQIGFIVDDGNYEYELHYDTNKEHLYVDEKDHAERSGNEQTLDFIDSICSFQTIARNIKKEYPNQSIEEFESESIGEGMVWKVQLSNETELAIDAITGKILYENMDD